MISVTNIRRRQGRDVESGTRWQSVAAVERRRGRCASLFVMACLLFLHGAPTCHSQDADTAEYPVKLAFLYNLTKFVEWPEGSYRDAGAPLAICIAGEDPFQADLEGELRARRVGGHPLEVRTVRPSDNLTSCRVVFIPVSARTLAAQIVKTLNGSSTLTVGEHDGFAAQGGIVNFLVEGNKLRLEVNRSAADRAGLKISSKLLNLAKIVRGPNAKGGI